MRAAAGRGVNPLRPLGETLHDYPRGCSLRGGRGLYSRPASSPQPQPQPKRNFTPSTARSTQPQSRSPPAQKELYSGKGFKRKRLASDATSPRFQSMWLLLSLRVCESVFLGPQWRGHYTSVCFILRASTMFARPFFGRYIESSNTTPPSDPLHPQCAPPR